MAGHTIVADRAMRVLILRDFLPKFRMTTETELSTGLDQVHFVVRSVWIMTDHTLPFTDRQVGALRASGN